MSEKEPEWISHNEVDYTSDKITQIHVDTRDFHCLADTTPHDIEMPKELLTEDRRYFFTLEEIKAIIERLFTESGGARKWRILEFNIPTGCWELKYLRFYKFGNDFISCTRHGWFKDKAFWQNKVAQDMVKSPKTS